ncbi:MAG TPA: hypothetical protein VFS24_19595 [Steroidobacteraceae bacterium]|nr:hypothetical protein [Steroidobacteraceae bacterium]
MRFTVVLFALAASMTSVAAAPQLPRYTITPIVLPEPTNAILGPVLTDLNNRGEVTLYNSENAALHGYVWKNGVIRELFDNAGRYVVPNGLNDSGVIVSNDFVISGRHLHRIDVHGGTFTATRDINNRGQILGRTYFPGSPTEEDFVLSPKGAITILKGVPDAVDYTWALAMNDRGTVVGQTGIRKPDLIPYFPAVWERGTVMLLPMPQNALSGVAWDINNDDVIVGEVQVSTKLTSAFLWHEGRLKILPPLRPHWAYSSADSVNDCGDAVGQSTELVVPGGRGVLWHKGKAFDLNRLVLPSDPLKPVVTLGLGLRINNHGQILAAGFDARYPAAGYVSGFFLSPTKPYHCECTHGH